MDIDFEYIDFVHIDFAGIDSDLDIGFAVERFELFDNFVSRYNSAALRNFVGN